MRSRRSPPQPSGAFTRPGTGPSAANRDGVSRRSYHALPAGFVATARAVARLCRLEFLGVVRQGAEYATGWPRSCLDPAVGRQHHYPRAHPGRHRGPARLRSTELRPCIEASTLMCRSGRQVRAGRSAADLRPGDRSHAGARSLGSAVSRTSIRPYSARTPESAGHPPAGSR